MRSRFWWGVTIGLCLLHTAIVAVYTCCGDQMDQGSAYKVRKKVCGHGWKSVDTSSPGSLTEGSADLSQSWGQQTLCLKVHHNPASWWAARDSCFRQHGILLDLDFPGFVSPHMVVIVQNLAREIWREGLRRAWTGMFVEMDKLWWDNIVPRAIYGKEPGHWWEWLEGQPGQHTGSYGRLDLKNGTNNMSPRSTWGPPLESSQPFLLPHPTSVFRLGLSLEKGDTLLPYACINNGFALPPTSASRCPQGWFGSPYIDKCLWFSDRQALPYKEAEGVCTSKGGRLVIPQNSFYNAFVIKVIVNAELGMLQADNPDVDETSSGHPEVMQTSGRLQCLFCNEVHSVEKCRPAADGNGSCSPEKACGLKVTKRSNGSLVYSGGCFAASDCAPYSEIALKGLCSVSQATYTLCCTTPECLTHRLRAISDLRCQPPRPEVPAGGATESQEVGECFTCTDVSSDEECISKGTVVRCEREFPSMRSPVCQTRLWKGSRHSRVKISKNCASSVDCHGAEEDCSAVSVAPKCVYCCRGNRCNQWLPSNPLLRTSAVRMAWIGFRKIGSMMEWSDGESSAVSAWNSTFGSLYRYLPASGCGQLWADRPWGSEWLVGDCSTRLPFVCEMNVLKEDTQLYIGVHPSDVTVSLSELIGEEDAGNDDVVDVPAEGPAVLLACGATNFHPEFSVVWVKDGRYYDNGPPPGGFVLDVITKVLEVDADDFIYNIQGEYHCEVWDKEGLGRTKSRKATVTLSDVITYQASLRIPTHPYNASVHNRATLLFNSYYRAGLEHYQRMLDLLTEYSQPGLDIAHLVNIKSYRPGSVVIDFTLYYELPSHDPEETLRLMQRPVSPSGGTRDQVQDHFRRLVLENMERKLSNRSSDWFSVYGTWGISESDITLHEAGACPEVTSEWQGRRLTWPRAPIGTTRHSVERCLQERDGRPMGSRRCEGSFRNGARWEEPRYLDNCQEEESAITGRLRSLSENDITATNMATILDQTLKLTTHAQVVAMADIVYASQILEQVSINPQVDVKSGRTALKVTSQLLTVNQTLLESAQKVGNSCNRMSTALQRLGRHVTLDSDRSATFVESNLIMYVYDVTNASAVVQGVAYDGRLGNMTEKHFRRYHRPESEALTSSRISISLPNQIRDILMSQEDSKSRNTRETPDGTPDGASDSSVHVTSGQVRLCFTVYQSAGLFVTGSPDGRNASANLSQHGVVSVDLVGVKVTNLYEPVLTTFTFQHDVSAGDVRCVFWDYSASNNSGDWSEDGCHVNKTNNGRVTCACNHIGIFSALVLKPEEHVTNPEIGRGVTLSLALILGLSISIACLGISIISFIAFRRLRKTRTQQVLVNVAIATLLCDVTFWVGVEVAAVRAYCVAMAALLHYCLLAAFTWTLVHALFQYLSVLQVSGLPAQHSTLKAALPAWVLPAVVVGIICAIDYNLYSTSQPLCWLSDLPLYLGFVLPVSVLLVVTIATSLCTAYRIKRRERSKSLKCVDVKPNITVGHILANLLCCLLLGGVWVLAYFALRSGAEASYDIAFAVTNAALGAYVLCLLLLLERESHGSLRQLCCGHFRSPKRDSDSSTTSSVGTISSKMAPPSGSLQKGTLHVEKNIYVACPSEKDIVVKI